tara:strand:+ start:570 stop:1136 length:567 start_codon:yes stop_codon:yes gene_type:complete
MSEVPGYTISTIAKLLDLSERHVRRLVEEGVLVKSGGKNSRYPITNVTFYIRYLRERAYGKTLSVTDLHTEKIRIAKNTADKTEIELKQLKNTIVETDQVLNLWTELVSNVKTKLLNLPSKLAHQVVGLENYKDAENLLNKEIYETLNELSDIDFPKSFEVSMEGDSEDIQTAPKAKGKRVGRQAQTT